jgi:hypothetical protein
MCLAQIALANPEYARFYKERAEEGKFVILDNGAAEENSVTYDQLMDVYDMIKPSEIIVPDKLMDKDATLKRGYEFVNHFAGRLRRCRIMLVPQGKDLADWIDCYLTMKENIAMDTVGVPKWLTKQGNLNRMKAVEFLSKDDIWIHLLGCNEPLGVINKCGEINPKVRSCDSAFPYLCAKAGKDHIDQNTRRPESVSIDFINDPYIEGLPSLLEEFRMGGIK